MTDTYDFTRVLPDDERYGLCAQMRRAAMSIQANIAEGAGRTTRPDFARLIHIAMGSSSELESYVLVSADLGFCERPAAEQLARRIRQHRRRMFVFAARLRRRS